MLTYAEAKLGFSIKARRDGSLHGRFQAVVSAIPSGSRVLDVDCGAGRLMAALRDNGCECYGIDISKNAISLARAKGLDVVTGDADAFDTDPAIASLMLAEYDAVIFSKCLMYLRNKNDLMARLRTRSVLVNQHNPIRWKNMLRWRFTAKHFERLPYVTAGGKTVDEFSLSGLREWGESYGFSMRVLSGSFFRGRDMVLKFSR